MLDAYVSVEIAFPVRADKFSPAVLTRHRSVDGRSRRRSRNHLRWLEWLELQMRGIHTVKRDILEFRVLPSVFVTIVDHRPISRLL